MTDGGNLRLLIVDFRSEVLPIMGSVIGNENFQYHTNELKITMRNLSQMINKTDNPNFKGSLEVRTTVIPTDFSVITIDSGKESGKIQMTTLPYFEAPKTPTPKERLHIYLTANNDAFDDISTSIALLWDKHKNNVVIRTGSNVPADKEKPPFGKSFFEELGITFNA